jgi:histidyl-tRNA synthetase
MKAIKKLREFGIKVELYPDAVKVGKQFMHADKRAIKYAIIVGETEMNEGKYALKNLVSGEQEIVNFEELKNTLINN